MRERLSSKATRIVIGTALIVVVGAVLLLDWVLGSAAAGSIVVSALGLLGFAEFCRISGLARGRGGSALQLLGFLGCAYFLLVAWFEANGHQQVDGLLAAGIFGLVAGGFLLVVFRGEYLPGFPAILALLLGVVLFGLLYSYLLRIYLLEPRSASTLRAGVFVLGVKGTDIVAYLVGSSVGRYRFLEVSPRKTLEGSLAALVQGAVWFSAASLVWPDSFFGWPQCILFGIILSLVTQLGDLTESLIKRYYEVKDSGSLLPEFGGVLDLIDSFLFSGFVFWSLL